MPEYLTIILAVAGVAVAAHYAFLVIAGLMRFSNLLHRDAYDLENWPLVVRRTREEIHTSQATAERHRAEMDRSRLLAKLDHQGFTEVIEALKRGKMVDAVREELEKR